MAWLDDYGFCKEISTTQAEEDYQVCFSIAEDAGGDWTLESHAEDFPNDLRFTDSTGSDEIPYWIEDLTVDPISVWVLCTDTSESIYCYYGKSGDTTTSSGNDTFELFDHFLGDALDTTTKWNIVSGTPSVSGSILTLYDASVTEQIRSKLSWGDGYSSVSRAYHFYDTQAIIGFWNAANHRAMWLGRSDDPKDVRQTMNGASATNIKDADRSGTTFYKYEVARYSGGASFYIDGAIIGDPITTNLPSQDTEVSLYNEKNVGVFCIDWALVRKYVATEPAFSSAGAEQSAPTGEWCFGAIF